MTATELRVSAHAALRTAIRTTLMPGFVGTELPEWLAVRLREGLGAICIFGPNIVSHAQLRRLTDSIRDANPHAVIAIDEEGGDVTRLYYDRGAPFPGNAVLGRLDDLDYTQQVGRRVGDELAGTGCTLSFAPDVDINSNPDNPVIGVRSFGVEPGPVSAHSAAWTRGLQAAGVAASAKHFPGHGDTALDSHLAMPVIDRSLQQLRERELLPFVAVIEAGTKTIMTSHILLPQIDPVQPATLSAPILQGLLRGELGFDGVIVSDALDMKGASEVHGIPAAAALALSAGCDLLCIGTKNTDAQMDEIEAAVVAAIESGELSAERVQDAARRVRELAVSTQVAPSAGPLAAAAKGEHIAVAAELERIAGSFELSPAASAWLESNRGNFQVLVLESEANIAVGEVPWGPHASDVVRSSGSTWGQQQIRRIAPGDALAQLEQGLPVLLLGRDCHRHDFARTQIDAARASGASTLVVDMGWPSTDREYADIATFGGSRLVGRALAQLLTRQSDAA